MKKIFRTALCFALSLSLILVAAVPAAAARPGTQFLSELYMAQSDSPESAKKLLTDNGFKVFDKNLNPGGAEYVYLGYKTSTNVEDAITDISVMNMNGGFSLSDYETMLKETFSEYEDMVKDYRTAANEFAANYNAGKEGALLAYRQLNYFYAGEGESKIKMGDYMLAFPEKDEEFADILMKGNPKILGNVRSLLAMGVGEGNYVNRVIEAAKDPAVFEKIAYYETAKRIASVLSDLDNMKKESEKQISDIKADDTLTEEEKSNLITFSSQNLDRATAVENMLSRIPYGDSNYYEYATQTIDYDYSVFYPLIEVMTEGQRALTNCGQFIPVLIYDEVQMTQEEYNEVLDGIEKGLVEISVFLGTDLEIFEGSFALTQGAINLENTTGNHWLSGLFNKSDAVALMGFVTAAGVGIAAASTVYLADAISSYQPEYSYSFYHTDSWDSFDYLNYFDEAGNDTMSQAASQYDTTVNNTVAQSSSGYSIAFASIGVAVGLALIVFGIYNVISIVNSYKPDYTDIPTTMIEAVETENGDRFIRYDVVNSYYHSDGEVKTRPGDANGYDGKQWVSIYYTKNYEAGKCLVATADWPTNEADFGKYTPVHPFGMPNVCFNLNDYNNNDNRDQIYLAFRNSSALKAAASSVPSVVGSLFNVGSIAISGAIGIGLGIGLMCIVNKKKKEE